MYNYLKLFIYLLYSIGNEICIHGSIHYLLVVSGSKMLDPFRVRVRLHQRCVSNVVHNFYKQNFLLQPGAERVQFGDLRIPSLLSLNDVVMCESLQLSLKRFTAEYKADEVTVFFRTRAGLLDGWLNGWRDTGHKTKAIFKN